MVLSAHDPFDHTMGSSTVNEAYSFGNRLLLPEDGPWARRSFDPRMGLFFAYLATNKIESRGDIVVRAEGVQP
jgi:hypothetical protein